MKNKHTGNRETRCIYCGDQADTKDHIPSRNLLKVSKKNTVPIKVPACSKCNNKFSKDEEYFRNLITAMCYKKSLTATFLFDNIVTRSIKKAPALTEQMIKQMELVDYVSKEGLYLGKRTLIKMTSKDYKRIYNILDKYTKGLFYYHFSKIIPSNWIIEHKVLPNKLTKEVKYYLSVLKWKIIDENVFFYGYKFFPHKFDYFWCWVFLKSMIFYSRVHEPFILKSI